MQNGSAPKLGVSVPGESWNCRVQTVVQSCVNALLGVRLPMSLYKRSYTLSKPTIHLYVCRPGWSEGPTGKQLTADLKNRRAVATFADLGACSPPVPRHVGSDHRNNADLSHLHDAFLSRWGH